ncbi:tRNA (guanosine(37)-N1)-methyltransferase TrmD [Candidatus Dependentiae bacterium]
MKISILSVFPEIYKNFLETSLVRRAKENGLVKYNLDSFRSFVAPKERIDAPTFGPGAGMVIKAEVVQKAIEAKEQKFGPAFKVFFSPKGKKLDQDSLRDIANLAQKKQHLMLLPARYEGMDVRVLECYADAVVSIGDFVLMGGDLPAMVFMEGFLRLIPSVVGKQESVQEESFSGPFVDYPSYGEPVEWQGYKVPDILRSGNHEEIRKWRLAQSAKQTVLEHFNWMRTQPMDTEQKDVAKSYIPAHYAALMHYEVLVRKPDDKQVGTTSVTTIDIHDIARSSKSFGLKNYFIVTPLVDQQKIVQTMLDFWQKGVGIKYNKSRFESVKQVELKSSLESVIAHIEKQEGKKPLIIATSAKKYDKKNIITFHDQEKVWQLGRPVLLLFGTGQGLSDDIVDLADFVLVPVEGFCDYNHLSVRSAAAIVFDRWLGLNVKKM